jgi:hypothetical protein
MSDLIDRIESARLAWVSARTLEDGAFERAKYERRLFEAWPTLRDELERLTRELAEAQQEIAAQVQNDYQRVDWIKENMRLVERAERAEADLTRYQTHVVFPSKDGTRNLTLSGTAEAADELARQRWAAESDREQLRAATIEECAKVCEYHADGYDESRMADPANTKRAAIYMNQASTARVIADAIRALSEPQAKEGEHADTLPDRGDVLRSWDAAMNKEGKHDA